MSSVPDEFAWPDADTVVVLSSGSTSAITQLKRAPWANPVNRKLRLRKLQVTQTSGQTGVLVLHDADLSNTTPTTRGTGTVAAGLMHFGLTTTSGLQATTIYGGEDGIPGLIFEAGIACTVLTTQSGNMATAVTGEWDIV